MNYHVYLDGQWSKSFIGTSEAAYYASIIGYGPEAPQERIDWWASSVEEILRYAHGVEGWNMKGRKIGIYDTEAAIEIEAARNGDNV